MSDGSVTQRLSTEGADPLTLAGVNDGNLVELSRLGGVKVALRGDTLTISGPVEFVERAVVAKLDADAYPEILGRYGIMGVPTLIFFKTGKEADRVIGVTAYKTLKARLEKLVG